MAADPQTNANQQPRDIEQVRAFLVEVQLAINLRPFKALPLFSGAHAQTLAAYAWPRRRRLHVTVTNDEARLFTVADNVQVLAQCRWQEDRQRHSTLVIWHGMEGSTSSIYMWSTAAKAFEAGFNVVRVNYRSCGDTEHLSPTLYHGGMSDDLRRVIEELITRDGLKRILPIGFSLGGNMVLKLAGEYGQNPPREVIAACVISPSVDLRASTDLILKGSNWIYHKNFVRSMKTRIRKKCRLYPEIYDISTLNEIKTIKDFDENFTSLANGFVNADDYYYRSSCIRVVDQIRVPTLILHAADDPFIPFEPMRQNVFTENPYLLVIGTERGGHVAFIASTDETEDRFWAENRAVDFCKLSESALPASEFV
jgi:predicted alpha/beta-fold hydrolase